MNVEIYLEAYDRPGLARDVATAVANRAINMLDFRAQKQSVEHATVHLVLELRDAKVLEGIMSDLRAIDDVTKVGILEDSNVPLADILRARPEGRPMSGLVKPRQILGMPNPYSPGRPIKRPNMFFGREREQRVILGYINPPYQGTSLLICGQRRIGKTSLVLRMAQHPLVDRGYVPVFVDLEHFRANNDYQVLRRIGRDIHHQVRHTTGLAFNPLQSVEHGEDLYSRVQEHLSDLHQGLQGNRILLILDEFEATFCSYQAGLLDEHFFWALRSWVQMQPMTLLIVGSDRLPAMMSRPFSDLLNAFVTERLDPLDPIDARLLIERPVECSLY